MKTRSPLFAATVRRFTAWSNSAGKTWTSNPILILAVVGLAGCAQAPLRNAGKEMPQTGEVSCAGDIVIPYGLVEVRDEGLLKQAQQPAGKGGLCKAKVFKVQQPLTVYRVWDNANAKTQFGRWWSFNPPAGPINAYRAENAICPEWSALNTVKQCRLKAGAEIVVGPGQSAQCSNDVMYPPSPNNQIFIPNDTRDANNVKLEVNDCLADASWP